MGDKEKLIETIIENKITGFNVKLKAILFLIIIFTILFVSTIWFFNGRINNFKEKYVQEQLLNRALTDTIRKHVNNLNEIVMEKSTFQMEIKNLRDYNEKLNDNQKKLLNRIDQLKHKNDLISAALIRTEYKIDSLRHGGKTEIDTTGKKVTFSDNSEFLTYKFIIGNIIPYKNKTPQLDIKDLTLPNEQFIDFHWENDDDYYQKPVSFTVTNTNPYINVVDMDSYIIPEVNKNLLKPTFGQKVGKFFKDSKNNIVWIGIGTTIGAFIGAKYLNIENDK